MSENDRVLWDLHGDGVTLSVRDEGHGYRLIVIAYPAERESICILSPDECRTLVVALYPDIAELLDRFDDRELRKMGEG